MYLEEMKIIHIISLITKERDSPFWKKCVSQCSHCFTSFGTQFHCVLFLDMLWVAQFRDVFHELRKASPNLERKCERASPSDISNTYKKTKEMVILIVKYEIYFQRFTNKKYTME